MMTDKEIIARALLKTGAVKVNVKEPFTFVSGIKSPIYCDNRKMIGFPAEREKIVDAFLKILEKESFDVVAGTATAGIPWASFIAQKLNLPMSYIRGEKKAHGAGRQIEGAELFGKSVIIIEDLISTGRSSIKAAFAAKEAGAESVKVVSIFSYNFQSAFDNFSREEIKWESISNFNILIDIAKNEGYLTEEDSKIALEWNKGK